MRLGNALTILAIAACSGKPAPTTSPTKGSGSAVAPGSGSAATIAPQGSAAPLAGGNNTVAPPPANANAVKVTLADVGLEASSLDRTADPCLDFYQFACGGWLANNQIPADRGRWSRFTEVEDKIKVATKSILEEAAKGIGADAATKKLGDYYAACMDEGAIERAGIAPIKPLLEKTTKVKNAQSWFAALTELHKLGIWVVFKDRVWADLKDSTVYTTYLDAPVLGLPDRDYYVKPELKDKLDLYKVHVGKLLGLAGVPSPDVAAADVVAIEIELAKLMKSKTEARDLVAAYNPTDAVALGKQVKAIDWKAYWKALGIDPGKKLVVTTPKVVGALDRLRGQFKFPQWGNYFTYHLAIRSAFSLPKAFDTEAFELDKILSGAEKPKERTKRCIESTEATLGELLGAQYVTKYFPATSRQVVGGYLDAMSKAMADELASATWLSEATRKTAVAKLGKTIRMVGFPDKFRTYDYEVKRDDFAGNLQRSAAFETHRTLSRAGKPADRGEWQMNPQAAAGYYSFAFNSIVIPAGILQPPFFGPDRSVAANLGAAMGMGHELTHGFDDQGAQFDADGNLKAWFTKEDETAFGTRAQCLVDQYTSFEALPKQFVNGKLTLGENIADAGGVKLAFKAYRTLRKDAAKVYVADGFDEDQQFFLGVAQTWCTKDRAAEVQKRLTSDVHAPPKFRVYGALRNLPEFSQAFKCAPGTPMHPATSCSVW